MSDWAKMEGKGSPFRVSAESNLRGFSRSAPADLQVAEHADPEAEPRIGELEELVALGLEADRREPQLVGGGVGNAAVQPAPHPSGAPPRRGRSDRVRPLHGVATLVQGA